MYRLVSVAILCCIFVIDNASGARDIVLLSGNAGKVSIDDYAGTIRITDGDAATFVFECFDDVTGDPADIELIGLSGTPSGTITVAILPGSGHTYGARQVKEIDLTTTGVTGNLAGLNISSHLGQDGDIALDNITGTVAVGGDVLHTIDIGNDITGAITIGGDLEAAIDVVGDITAGITITGYLLADITADSADDITANGDSGTHSGDITISGAYSAAICLNDTMSGTITIDGNVSAPGGAQKSLYINGDMDGSIDIVGTLSGSIEIEGDIDEEDDGKHIRIRVMDGGARRIGPMSGILPNWTYPRVSVIG